MSERRLDYYEILQVTRSATDVEIKTSFRRLAREHHPDLNPGDAVSEERFKIINEAYSVLSDATKRDRYDRFGGDSSAAAQSYERVDFRSVSDLFEGLMGEVFRGQQAGAKIGADIERELSLRFEEAALGVEKNIEIERTISCSACEGKGGETGSAKTACATCKGSGEVRSQRGFFSASRPCTDCGGRGVRYAKPCAVCVGTTVVQVRDTLKIRIPKGTQDGAVRSIRGAGNAAANGGTVGDLHLTIKVEAHPLFVRQGSDVLVTVPVSFPQAVLGSQIDVPTLEGKVKMKVPPGSQSGKVFRLRDKGIEAMGGVRGDLLVTLLVEVPDQVTKKQKKLIEDLAGEFGEGGEQQKGFLSKLKEIFGG